MDTWMEMHIHSIPHSNNVNLDVKRSQSCVHHEDLHSVAISEFSNQLTRN